MSPADPQTFVIQTDLQSGQLDLSIARAVGPVQEAGDSEAAIAAVVIMHVVPNDMIAPMLHTGGGFGRTGEALLVDREGRVLAPLKHPLSDGSTAKPLEYRITAEPAVLAAGGAEGIISAEDYRGERVLAAYRYIPVSPGVGWGMVSTFSG